MKKKHLATKELRAIYHGDTGDFAALEHLASCARCKKAFDDSGWVRLLQQLPELVEAGPHLELDELGAYRHSALPAPRVAEIERHLRSCSSCLAFYQRSRTAEQTVDYLSPRPEQVLQARRDFRPDKVRWLGTVLFTGLGRGPRAILLPERRVASGPELFAGAPPALVARHPSSAKRRARRLHEQLDRVRSAAAGSGSELAEDSTFPVAPEATVDPLRVGAGDWDILIHATAGTGLGCLELQLVSVGRTRPVCGVAVVIEGPNGDGRSEVPTDGEGRAALPVSSGRSRIVVGVEPPLALSLTVVD